MREFEKCLVIGDRKPDAGLMPASIVDPNSPTLTALLLTENNLDAIAGERDERGALVCKVIPLGEDQE